MCADALRDAEALARAARVLADETGLCLLLLLGGGEMNVGELVERTGFDHPAVSHHLGTLGMTASSLPAARASRPSTGPPFRPPRGAVRIAVGTGGITVAPR